MSNQENIKKLSDLREKALKAIKAYNELAELENYETRIGCIDATLNDYEKTPYYYTQFPGVESENWVPSGINC